MRLRHNSTGRTPTSAALAAFLLTALLPSEGTVAQPGGETEDPFAHLPMTMTLTGVVRDFKGRNDPGGHDDFERKPSSDFGHYMGIVQDQLDADGKPVFASTGEKVTRKWKDAEGRNIIREKHYLASMPGDESGSADRRKTGAVTTAANFHQWFRDVPGVNLSKPLSITLEREEGSPKYVFDDKHSKEYRNGFFPIDGELYLNNGRSHNYHFTYELSMNFIYKSDLEQTFTFIGDDDVWVFVDDMLVIDLGGVHEAETQTIDLHRCDWLIHNETYTLRFFFAERHTTESNFRIETTLSLMPAELPTVSALFD